MTPPGATLRKDPRARDMREAQLREHIRVICQGDAKHPLPDAVRIRIAFVYDSRHSPKGWPDLVLGGSRGVLFRELKTETGRLTVEQRDWLDCLGQAGMDVGVWRPTDLCNGRVAAELAAIR